MMDDGTDIYKKSLAFSDKKKTKYRAIPTEVDGIRFASKKEARRYGELKLLERAGEISQIKIHPRYDIRIKGQHICWVALDFEYMNGSAFVYEDVKGGRATDTPMSRLKRKLVQAQYGIKVNLV